MGSPTSPSVLAPPGIASFSPARDDLDPVGLPLPFGKPLRGLLASFFLLLLLEGVLRIAHTVRSDLHERSDSPDREWYRPDRDLGWTWTPGFRGLVFGALRAFDSTGLVSEDSEQRRRSDRKNVLFLGDSNTFGIYVPVRATFVEVADSLLGEVDLINAAVVGYSSHQGLTKLLKDGLAFQPDLIVASFNFNDRRSVPAAKDADGPRKFERVFNDWARKRAPLRAVTDRVYLSRAIRSLLRSFGLVSRETQGLAARVDSLKARVSPENYRSNLSQMAEWARKHGRCLAFLKLDDNPEELECLMRGIAQLERSQIDSAIVSLKIALRRGKASSDLARLHLARAYRIAGRHSDADAVLAIAEAPDPVMGGRPIHSDAVYHEILFEVARRYGLPVIDGGALLEEDPSCYLDSCHFDETGHARIGRLLARRIEEILKESPRSHPRLEGRLNQGPE
jgi:lysophospholipase L1-like esterase